MFQNLTLHFNVHQVSFFSPDGTNSIHHISASADRSRLAVVRRHQLKPRTVIEIWGVLTPIFRAYQQQIINEDDAEPTMIEATEWISSNSLMACSLTGRIYHFDLSSGQVKRMEPIISGPAWCLSYCASNETLAVGTETGFVVFYTVQDVPDFNLRWSKVTLKHDQRLLCLKWYRTKVEDFVVTGSMGCVKIYSHQSGICVRTLELSDPTIIVWSLLVLKDFLIVTGDSLGFTSLWNGEHGSLINSLQTHKADILTVCNDLEDPSIIYSTGVDADIVISSIGPNAAQLMKRVTWNYHINDIRSLVAVDGWIISGGDDSYLSANKADTMGTRFIRYSIDYQRFINLLVTKNHDIYVMMSYSRSLELWKLDRDIVDPESMSEPKLFFRVGTKRTIHSSAISEKWFAYTHYNTISIFSWSSDGLIKKVNFSQRRQFSMINHISFTTDNCLAVASGTMLHILELDESGVSIVSVFSYPQRIHSICGSREWLAVALISCKVVFYKVSNWNVNEQMQIASLPTAMKFNLTNSKLLIALCDQCVIISYEIDAKHFERYEISELDPYRPLRGIVPLKSRPGRKDSFLVYDEWNINVVVDGVHSRTTNEFKFNLFIDAVYQPESNRILALPEMVIVELPPASIIKRLPPSLAKHKFLGM